MYQQFSTLSKNQNETKIYGLILAGHTSNPTESFKYNIAYLSFLLFSPSNAVFLYCWKYLHIKEAFLIKARIQIHCTNFLYKQEDILKHGITHKSIFDSRHSNM